LFAKSPLDVLETECQVVNIINEKHAVRWLGRITLYAKSFRRRGRGFEKRSGRVEKCGVAST
jgi:hypothetical protein